MKNFSIVLAITLLSFAFIKCGKKTPPVTKVQPTACFTADKQTVINSDMVHFTNCSKDATSYEWDMGDGSAKLTTKDVNYFYTIDGNYTVTMTAYNADKSLNAKKTMGITVTPIDTSLLPPVACMTIVTGPDSSGYYSHNCSVKFSADCSEHAYAYKWFFHDDRSYSTEKNPTHITNCKFGQYAVVIDLTIWSKDGTKKDSITRDYRTK